MGKRSKVKSGSKSSKPEIANEVKKMKMKEGSFISEHNIRKVVFDKHVKQDIVETVDDNIASQSSKQAINMNTDKDSKEEMKIHVNKSCASIQPLEPNSNSSKKKSRKSKASASDIGKTSHSDNVQNISNKKTNSESLCSVNVPQVKLQMTTDNEDRKTQNEKNKDLINVDEDDIKDEDIDRFCEDITEEDNAEYENWIQLLEAKLHPNKKT